MYGQKPMKMHTELRNKLFLIVLVDILANNIKLIKYILESQMKKIISVLLSILLSFNIVSYNPNAVF